MAKRVRKSRTASEAQLPRLLRESSPADADVLGAAEEGLRRIDLAERLDEEIGGHHITGGGPATAAIPTSADIARDVVNTWREMADLVGGLVGSSRQELMEQLGEVVRMPEPRRVRAEPETIPAMSEERLLSRIRIPRKWQETCPKRPGTEAYHNWTLYRDGMTVGEYLSNPDVIGGRRRARRDIQWDVDHRFVWIQSPADWQLDQEEVGDEARRVDAELG